MWIKIPLVRFRSLLPGPIVHFRADFGEDAFLALFAFAIELGVRACSLDSSAVPASSFEGHQGTVPHVLCGFANAESVGESLPSREVRSKVVLQYPSLERLATRMSSSRRVARRGCVPSLLFLSCCIRRRFAGSSISSHSSPAHLKSVPNAPKVAVPGCVVHR